jgi:hypothetical protein
MGVGSQRHDLAALPPGKGPSTNFTGSWVDLEAGLKGYGKFRRHRSSKPRTFQPVASRYTDWDIPVASRKLTKFNLNINRYKELLNICSRWKSLLKYRRNLQDNTNKQTASKHNKLKTLEIFIATWKLFPAGKSSSVNSTLKMKVEYSS